MRVERGKLECLLIMTQLNCSDKSEREQRRDKLFWERRKVGSVNTNNAQTDWNGSEMKSQFLIDHHPKRGSDNSDVNQQESNNLGLY